MKSDYFKVLPQYCVPQHFLSRSFGKLGDLSHPAWLKNTLIKKFIHRYGVNMAEAIQTNPESYESFNQFFTRKLLPEARPIAKEATALISPADGAISEIGKIAEDRLLQAKGHDYQLLELLGGNAERASAFVNGSFATIYLSPKDYHRVHMPIDGQLEEMCHVPGKLFSVNFRTANTVPRLFARNERLVTYFQTAVGQMAVILVGAMIVASIGTSWSGLVKPSQKKAIQVWHPQEVMLKKADELGYFQLGSTVILLFQPNAVVWEQALEAGSQIQFGQPIARFRGE